MTAINPVLVNQLAGLQIENGANQAATSQPVEFANIFTAFFSNLETGSDNPGSQQQYSLKNFLSRIQSADEKNPVNLEQLWQELSSAGNSLPDTEKTSAIVQALLNSGLSGQQTSIDPTQQLSSLTEGLPEGQTAGMSPLAENIRKILLSLNEGQSSGVAQNTSILSDALKASALTDDQAPQGRSLQEILNITTPRDQASAKFGINLSANLANSAEPESAPVIESPPVEPEGMDAMLEELTLPGKEMRNTNEIRANGAALENLVSTSSKTPEPQISVTPVGMDTTGKGVEHTGKTAPESFTLQQNLHKPEWAGELGNRISWMAKEGMKSAYLRLNPAHLGPVEIRISVQNDQTSVNFITQHAVVRDALEASIPRLREMMDNNGFNLADVDVSEHSRSGHREKPEYSADDGAQYMASGSSASGEDELLNEASTQINTTGRVHSAVDYFV